MGGQSSENVVNEMCTFASDSEICTNVKVGFTHFTDLLFAYIYICFYNLNMFFKTLLQDARSPTVNGFSDRFAEWVTHGDIMFP